MDTHNTLHDRIEDYLLGRMETHLRTGFEAEISNDHVLRNEVERHRLAMTALQYGNHLARKQRLVEIDKEMGLPKTQHRRITPIIRGLAVAASILLAIAAGAHLYVHQTYGHRAMANRFLYVHQGDVLRGDNNNVAGIDALFAGAEKQFLEGRYDEAINIYRELTADESMLQQHAEWNLLMACLAADSSSREVHVLLSRILQNPTHTYHADAVKLQRRIGSTWYRIIH